MFCPDLGVLNICGDFFFGLFDCVFDFMGDVFCYGLCIFGECFLFLFVVDVYDERVKLICIFEGDERICVMFV